MWLLFFTCMCVPTDATCGSLIYMYLYMYGIHSDRSVARVPTQPPTKPRQGGPLDPVAYEELKTMSEIKFMFREKEGAVDFASGGAYTRMKLYILPLFV